MVLVLCLRAVPSTRPLEPNLASVLPAVTQSRPRLFHQVTVPVVEPVDAASAVISWVPPPVSAIRLGRWGEWNGQESATAAGVASASRAAPSARAVRIMPETVRGPPADVLSGDRTVTPAAWPARSPPPPDGPAPLSPHLSLTKHTEHCIVILITECTVRRNP
ncbi:hypothetical protein A8W25_04365 [Streptomyces sp. ERV7]|nr:hypothetical protein A8W25_04365 [Streptomyces sp. ERV7]